MSHIPFLTSLKPLHRFASNFLWMGGPLPSLLKSGATPFSMGFWVILCNFWSILKNSYVFRPLTRNHSSIWLGKSPETLFLVYSGTYIYSSNKRSLFNPFLTIS